MSQASEKEAQWAGMWRGLCVALFSLRHHEVFRAAAEETVPTPTSYMSYSLAVKETVS